MRKKSTTLFEAERREKAPGQFATLSGGATHYEWHGPEDGKILVLVHGFSTPSFVWRGILPPLIEKGYRILSYDLFGRGWSDRPDADYSLEFHRRQLDDLLASQSIKTPFYLVGYSMGALISADFARQSPERITQLHLIAPAGLGTTVGGVPKALTWPIIGPFLAETVMQRRLLTDMAKPQNGGSSLPYLLERYREQMQYPGYMRALRATLLNLPLANAAQLYEGLSATDIPVSAIWGSNDTVTPPEGAQRLRDLIPRAQTEIVEGPSHAITYAQADIVAASITSNG